MKSLDLPYSDDRYYNLDQLEHVSPLVRLPEIWVERLHVIATAVLCTLTLFISFLSLGEFGTALSLGMGFLCLLALMASGRLRILFGDLYRQFQYREKFALFLIHVAVLVLPWLVLGVRPWSICFAILLIFMCLQGINHLFFARINFLCFLIVFWSCAFGSVAPGGAWLALWVGFWLMSVRFSYIRFRLEQYGEGRGVPVYGMLRRTLIACLVPPAVGYGVWMMISGWTPRGIRFPASGGYVPPDGDTPIFFSVSEIVWRSIGLVVAIVIILVALAWIDKHLRKQKAGNIPVDDTMNTTGGVYEMKEREADTLTEEQVSGAREKILSAFQRFSKGLSGKQLDRHTDETAPGYFERLKKTLKNLKELGPDLADPFEKACYSQEEITDQEADLFQEILETKLELIQKNPFDEEDNSKPQMDTNEHE